LLAECQVLAIKSPPKRLLGDFKAFLKRKHGILTTKGRRYEELRRFEFVSLDTEEDPDRMTDVVESMVSWFSKEYFKVSLNLHHLQYVPVNKRIRIRVLRSLSPGVTFTIIPMTKHGV